MLANIQTYNGIEYAYQAEGEFNTLYVATCNEFGEIFRTKFYGKSDYNKKQLMQIGERLAQTWGAKCLKVERG